MMLQRNFVIEVFLKYNITRAEIGSTDNAQDWFVFQAPQRMTFAWVRQENSLEYSRIAQKVLQRHCQTAGIDFQVLDNELKQCECECK